MSLPISVVVVTWNSARVLPASLASLGASQPLPSELLVVDNASTDASLAIVEAFAKRTPAIRVTVIRQAVNTGFAAGANRGIDAATEAQVFLMNPDLRLGTSTLQVLTGALNGEPAEIAAAGPKLLRATGDDLAVTDLIDSTGIVMTRDGRHVDRGAGESDHGQFETPGEVFGISGSAVLFRRNVLDQSRVAGEIFDEDFFAYREDADLAWRLRGFGYGAIYVPSAVAWHLRHVTPERRRSLSAAINRHSVKNRFLLRIHHADRGWLLRFGLRSLARDLVVLGACLTIERSSLSAFPWLARHLRRHLRRRSEMMARRTVSSAELRRWFS